MSDKQWGELMTGDESMQVLSLLRKNSKTSRKINGISVSFYPFIKVEQQKMCFFLTMIKENDIIPGNSHFDTTKGHIEFRKAHAVDCTIDEALI